MARKLNSMVLRSNRNRLLSKIILNAGETAAISEGFVFWKSFDEYIKSVTYLKVFRVSDSRLFISNSTVSVYLQLRIDTRFLKTVFYRNQIQKSELTIESKRAWIVNYIKWLGYSKRVERQKTLGLMLLHPLKKFFGNKVNILFVYDLIDAGSTSVERMNFSKRNNLKKALISLRKFSKSAFFKELTVSILESTNSKALFNLLPTLIAEHFKLLKRHGFFFSYIKKCFQAFLDLESSKLKGLKLVFKGRINGKPRARSWTIQCGKVSLQTIDANIVFTDKTCFTQYGTFGIKLWGAFEEYIA